MAAPAGGPPGDGDKPVLVLTRPREEADVWASAFRDRGWPVQTLPLIETGAPSSPEVHAALNQARLDWPGFDALMFVSAAAVRHFFEAVDASEAASSSPTRFWAPGPGTARELRRVLLRLGVPADRVDAPPDDAAQFDSEHLWPQVQDQVVPGRRLLIVRGGSPGQSVALAGDLAGQGRDWLIRQCQERGALVQACAAYERRPPRWDESTRALAQACLGAGHTWIFSSSEAVSNLQQAWPRFDARGTAALATHPRIAAAARAAGFGPVHISRPALQDVLVALESNRAPT